MLVVATISPGPTDELCTVLRDFSTVVTVEAHYVVGGIGSLVCEAIAGGGLAARVRRIGVGEPARGISGSETYMNAKHGLTSSQITDEVRAMLRAQSSAHAPKH